MRGKFHARTHTHAHTHIHIHTRAHRFNDSLNKTEKSDNEEDEEEFLTHLTFGEDPIEYEKKLMRHYDRLAKDVLEEHFTTQVKRFVTFLLPVSSPIRFSCSCRLTECARHSRRKRRCVLGQPRPAPCGSHTCTHHSFLLTYSIKAGYMLWIKFKKKMY